MSFHRNKTHCPRGNSYDDANTGRQGKERYCRECRNATRRERRLLRGAVPRRQPITCNGETHFLEEWERITGIAHSTIACRIARGWPIESAFREMPDKTRRRESI